MAGRQRHRPHAISRSSSIPWRRGMKQTDKWLSVAGSFCLLVIFVNLLLLHNSLVMTSWTASNNAHEYSLIQKYHNHTGFRESKLAHEPISQNRSLVAAFPPQQHRRVTENVPLQPSNLAVHKILQRAMDEYSKFCPSERDGGQNISSASLRGNKRTEKDTLTPTPIWEQLQRYTTDNTRGPQDIVAHDTWIPPPHCQRLLARLPRQENQDTIPHGDQKKKKDDDDQEEVRMVDGEIARRLDQSPKELQHPANFIMLWTGDSSHNSTNNNLRSLFLQVLHLLEDGSTRRWEMTKKEKEKQKKVSNTTNTTSFSMPQSRLVAHRIWLVLAPHSSSSHPLDSYNGTTTETNFLTTWELLAQDTNYGRRLLAWHHQPQHPLRIIAQQPTTTTGHSLEKASVSSPFSFWNAMDQLVRRQDEDEQDAGSTQSTADNSSLPWVWIHGDLWAGQTWSSLSKRPSLARRWGRQWESLVRRKKDDRKEYSSLATMVVNMDGMSSSFNPTYPSCTGEQASSLDLDTLDFFQGSLWTEPLNLCMLQHPSMAFIRNITHNDWHSASYAALLWLSWLTPQRYFWTDDESRDKQGISINNNRVSSTRQLDDRPSVLSETLQFFGTLPPFEQLVISD